MGRVFERQLAIATSEPRPPPSWATDNEVASAGFARLSTDTSSGGVLSTVTTTNNCRIVSAIAVKMQREFFALLAAPGNPGTRYVYVLYYLITGIKFTNLLFFMYIYVLYDIIMTRYTRVVYESVPTDRVCNILISN